jgi:hypothetical protein
VNQPALRRRRPVVLAEKNPARSAAFFASLAENIQQSPISSLVEKCVRGCCDERDCPRFQQRARAPRPHEPAKPAFTATDRWIEAESKPRTHRIVVAATPRSAVRPVSRGTHAPACDDGRGTIAVRRNVPPINRRHVRRLTPELQCAHTEWVEMQLAEPPQATARRRARRLALALLEQGDDPDHTERVLHTVGFHPSICHESTRWAYDHYRADIDALGESA